MTAFEPQTSSIASDRSTNWAVTSSHPFNTFRELIIDKFSMTRQKGKDRWLHVVQLSALFWLGRRKLNIKALIKDAASNNSVSESVH